MSTTHIGEMDSPSSPPLTVSEVAAELRTTPRTVQRWIREGRLRAVRIPGGSYRIYRADLNAAMEASA